MSPDPSFSCCRSRWWRTRCTNRNLASIEVGFRLLDATPEELAPDQRQEHKHLVCYCPACDGVGDGGGDTAEEGDIAGVGGGDTLHTGTGKGQAAHAGHG